MNPSDDLHSGAGRLALAVVVVAVASLCSLAVFFAVGGPFGSLNDIGNALLGVLSALLAWELRPGGTPPTSRWRVALALLGAALAIVGSALVVSGTTGFLLAGLVSSVGFALIGLWVIALNRSHWSRRALPRPLQRLGLAAGVAMALGLAAAPGIVMGFDDMVTAPGRIWIGFVGWIGIFILYPAWALLIGRRLVG